MTALRVLAARLLALVTRGRRDAELNEEIEAHLDLLTQEHVGRGLSPGDARAAARRRFGGVEQVKEAYRDQRGLPFVDALAQDLRFGLRSLMKRPLLLVTATLSIGIGVGLNVSVYSALTRLLWHTSLSGAPADERLVEIGGEFSFPNYADLRASDAFTGIAAMQVGTLLWQTDTGTERIGAKVVSANFFDVLRVRPVYGRAFHGAEDAQSIVLGFNLWRRRFSSDPSVIGQTMTLNGWPFVIAGVLPKEFHAPLAPFVAADVYAPISPLVCKALSERGAAQFDLIARLADGVTPGQASAALKAEAAGLAGQFPRVNARFAQSLSLRPAAGIELWRQLPGGGFGLMMTAAVTVYAVFILVLLVACANVAGLLLARAQERRREIAISAALGASRRRLAQRIIAEGAIIATIGCAAGGALYAAGSAALARFAWASGGLDVIAPPLPPLYCGALVLVITAACSLAPALTVNHVGPAPVLASNSPASGRRVRGANVLVAAQVATCFVLLSGAFILLHALLRLRTADPGFDVDHTIALDVRLPTTPPAPSAADDPYRRISGVLGRLPAVESVSCVRYLPLTIMGWRATVHMETAVDVHLDVDVHPVGPRYLETMRIPLQRGRDLAEDDVRQARVTGKPIVVNETLARRIFGLADPIGRRLTLEKDGGDQMLQIVGVARDSKLRSLNEDSHPVLYLPELTTSFVVRVAGPAAAAVRSVVNAVADSERGASVQANPMRAQVAVALAPTRVGGGLLGGLSALGLVLAMTGLYAVVNHAAKRRTFEFGVRIALGATSGVIMRLILRQGLSVVVAGCAVGGVLTFLLARILSPLLAAGQRPIDLPALGAVGATLALTGLAASVGPARRAARVDPVVALRHE